MLIFRFFAGAIVCRWPCKRHSIFNYDRFMQCTSNKFKQITREFPWRFSDDLLVKLSQLHLAHFNIFFLWFIFELKSVRWCNRRLAKWRRSVCEMRQMSASTMKTMRWNLKKKVRFATKWFVMFDRWMKIGVVNYAISQISIVLGRKKEKRRHVINRIKLTKRSAREQARSDETKAKKIISNRFCLHFLTFWHRRKNGRSIGLCIMQLHLGMATAKVAFPPTIKPIQLLFQANAFCRLIASN